MRRSVKGTKWITKCKGGLWVGGWRMKSVIFQHPSAVSLLTGRGKKLGSERQTEGGDACGGHCARSSTSTARFNCSICTAYEEIRERKRGRTKAVSLFESQSPCLFGQAGFACWVYSPEPRGRVGWGEVGGNSHLHGVQGVAALGTALFSTGVLQCRSHVWPEDTRSAAFARTNVRFPFFLFSLH